MAEGYVHAGYYSPAGSRGQKTDDKYGFLMHSFIRREAYTKFNNNNIIIIMLKAKLKTVWS